MTDESNKSLSGVWTGVFDYDQHWGDATPFNAILAEEGGALSGEIVEPNTVADDVLPEIFASLQGARVEREVSFVKTYEDRPGAGHAVQYSGVVDPKLSAIRGEWTISGGLGGRGPFIMNRADNGAEEAIATERSVEEEIEAIFGTDENN